MREREQAALTSSDEAGRGLRLEFYWHSDRYAHRIVRLGEPAEVILLESLEGAGDDVWPPSPPLQQLSIERIRTGVEVALLVGMAGKSHWSVSVEPAAPEVGFVFDVACRLYEPTGWLGSSYAQREHAPSCEMVGWEVGDTRVEKHPRRGVARPGLQRQTGGTVRWKYSIVDASS